MEKTVTLGSLSISQWLTVPAQVKSNDNGIAWIEGADKAKRVKLHTFHGVERSTCEALVDSFAAANQLRRNDLHCEWVCRDFV